MQRIRPVLRFIAVFFLLNIFTQILYPSVALALTSGPNAPEATSFEPFDTTDMVNLATGDFTYSLPLLEVPGPAGGYPLSLSYHAGITPGMEASWVGLGWNLNPGAINRSVNGIADDHDQAEGSRTDFWAGGVRHSGTVGVSVGVAGTPASVGFGVQIAHDTYDGIGIGHYMGVSIGHKMGENVGAGINFRVGTDPYGNSYATTGVGAGIGASSKEGFKLGIGVSATMNKSSTSFGGGVGVSYSGQNNSYSVLGASISSGANGPKASMSVGGGSASASNANFGKMSTSTSSIGGDIPVYPGVNLTLSYSKTRYWMDAKSITFSSGTLYGPGLTNARRLKDDGSPTEGPSPSRTDENLSGPYLTTSRSSDWHAFDSYSLLDENELIKASPNAEQASTGTFLDTDNFRVSAQGIAGNIRPYAYNNAARYQNVNKDDVKHLENIHVNVDIRDHRPSFRFIGDFSNKYIVDAIPSIDVVKTTDVYGNPTDAFLLSRGSAEIGLANQGNVPGSRYIEYFTNADIINTSTGGIDRAVIDKGFIENNTTGFDRGYLISTDRSEYESVKNSSNIGAFTITNTSGVRYHYSLPVYSYDEVVISENTGTAAHQSGKTFTKVKKTAPYAYTWLLTAVTGPDYVDRDSNGKVNIGDWGYWVEFDYGLWHEAYRWRNPGVGYHMDEDNNFRNFSTGLKEIYYLDAVRTASHTAYFIKESRNDAKSAVYALKDHDSYSVTKGHKPYIDWEGTYHANKESLYCVTETDLFSETDVYVDYQSRPVSQLALKKVVLTKNGSNSPLQKNISDNYDYNFGILEPSQCQSWVYDFPYYNKTNTQSADFVLDVGDVVDKSTFEQNALQVIELEQDYSLMPLTPNSYNNDLIYKQDPQAITTGNAASILTGKLSLKAVHFKGKGGQGSGIIPPISFDYGTNNPNYSSDKIDIWGMYKFDFDMSRAGTTDQTARLVTNTSAAKYDAWSLKKINTSVGATVEVEFEPDDYRKPVHQTSWLGVVSKLVPLTNDQVRISVTNLGDFTDFALVGTKVEILVESYKYLVGTNECTNAFPYDEDNYDKYNKRYIVGTIDSVDPYNKSIIVTSSDLWSLLSHNGPVSDLEPNKTYKTKATAATIRFDVAEGTIKGGGLRVKHLAVLDYFTKTYSLTKYGYRDKDNLKLTSGVTSYEPTGLSIIRRLDDYTCPDFKISQNYKGNLYKGFHQVMQAARIIPAPGVIYEHVTVEEQTGSLDQYGKSVSGSANNMPGKTIYNFQVYNANMVAWQSYPVNINVPTKFNDKPLSIYRAEITDKSTNVGNLKSITNYDNSSKKISEMQYSFSDEEGINPELAFDGQGVLQEMQYNARKMRKDDGSERFIAIISHRKEFPVVQLGTTNINYRTGVKTTSKNLGFDFLSGEATKSVTEDNLGNRYLTELVPAYQVKKTDATTGTTPVYPQMGHKLINSTYKHMLSQIAETYVYKVNADNVKLALVSAMVQTWSNKTQVVFPVDHREVLIDQDNNPYYGNVYRKESTYSYQANSFNPDGTATLDANVYNPFSWSTYLAGTDQNQQWLKSSTISKYNIFSKALEAQDVNGNFTSTHTMRDGNRILASAINASYAQFDILAEEMPTYLDEKGGWYTKPDLTLHHGFAHSGTKSFAFPAGKQGTYFATDVKDGQPPYQLMFWIEKGFFSTTGNTLKVNSYVINNGVQSQNTTKALTASDAVAQSGDHYVMKLSLPASATGHFVALIENSGSTTAYLDDIRIHPVNASVISYIYDESTDELTHILDANNFYTRYSYDAMGKLKQVYVEKPNVGEKLVSEHQYNYGNTHK